MVVSVIPEEVNRIKVTFKPPEEPNGNITAYFVYVYEKEKLVKNVSLNITKRDHNMMTAVIEGLKGGHSYSIQVVQVDALVALLVSLAVINHPFLTLPADFCKERGRSQPAQPPRPDNYRDQRYASHFFLLLFLLFSSPLCTALHSPLFASVQQCGFNWRQRIATSLFVAQHKRELVPLSPA